MCRLNHEKPSATSTDIKLESCAAYGQVSAGESTSHYESVRDQNNIYDN